jgi:hypothetical protein
MALDAHIVRGLKMEKMLVLGTVRPMAAQALQGSVRIPGINDLLADGMRRMRLPFVAVSAEIENRRFI